MARCYLTQVEIGNVVPGFVSRDTGCSEADASSVDQESRDAKSWHALTERHRVETEIFDAIVRAQHAFNCALLSQLEVEELLLRNDMRQAHFDSASTTISKHSGVKVALTSR